MKFALSALLGAASASNFLQEAITELDSTKAATPVDYSKTDAWKKYAINNKVGEMICQPHEGVIFWDLKPMDASKSVDYIGKDSKTFDNHTFAVELCENSFDATAKTMKSFTSTTENSKGQLNTFKAPTSTIGKGNAYWTEGSDQEFQPIYSFLSGNFVSVQDAETDKYTGWTLTYASQEPCTTTAASAPEPFVYTINAVCDEKETTGVWSNYAYTAESVMGGIDSCKASVTYTGKSGCVAFNGNATWNAIAPFFSIILILVGGVMTFAGAKFLFQLVSAIVTLITTIVFYLLVSNIFFDLKTGAGYKIGLMIVALALGLGAAWFSYKFTIRFAIPIVAAVGGGFGFKLLSNLAGIRNEYAVIGVLVLGAVAGAFVGYKLNEFVRTIGTAFLGSYIFIRGTGLIFGGFPEGASDVNVHELKGHDKIVWYFVGFVVMFIAGSVVQYKLFHHDEELKKQQDDVFEGQDDGEKKCGCF